MYIFGTITCIISAIIYGVQGEIPAMVGFICASIGGGCAYMEEKKRDSLEDEIKTLSGWGGR